MNSVMTAIVNILKADSTLVNMLGSNKPFYSKGVAQTSSKSNSFIPADMLGNDLNTPIISLGFGTRIRIGDTALESETVYIRCYNDINKSYVEINNIIQRIKLLLDNANLSLSEGAFVKITFDSLSDGLPDEPLNMKFREIIFQVLVL